MRLLANLDAEATWGGVPLPGKVVRRISQLAPLLASLAPAGDGDLEIWAPAAIDPATVRWEAIGRRATLHVGLAPWDLAWADPTAKAANDRRVTVAVQRELGIDHAHVVTEVRELDALARGAWVAKAPWTAAGRDRIVGEGALRADQRTYAERLLARQGALVVEPLLDRRYDLGVCARLERGRVVAEAPHTLLCDARGAFLGIDLTPPALTAPQRERLDEVVEASGRALAALQYEGPFTVDAFVYGNDLALHAPCEINARHSFGHVARALGGTRLGFGPVPAGARLLVESAELTAWRA